MKPETLAELDVLRLKLNVASTMRNPPWTFREMRAVLDMALESAALRTQLEQAQQAYFEEVIASAALREALAGIEKYADSFLNTHFDNYTLREISKQARGALSGEQG